MSPAPGPLVLVLTIAALYGWSALRARGGGGARAMPTGRIVLGGLGIGVIGAALLPPIDELAGESFTMHMTQHLLLADVGSTLLILGLTKQQLRPVTRRLLALEETLGPLGSPWFAVAAYVGVMWGWHVPGFYDTATGNDFLHVTGHLAFLGAGFLYWWHLLSPIRRRLLFGGFHAVVYMVITKLLVGALGAGLTFAPDALYTAYEDSPRIGDLDVLSDQAVGGALMAVEQSVVMGIALAWLFVRALTESERRQQQEDRRADR